MKRRTHQILTLVLFLCLLPLPVLALQLEESKGAPEVVETFPRDSAVDIPVDSRVMIVFSRPLRRSDVNEFTVTLNDGVADLASTVQYNGELKKAVLIPLEDLLPKHVYYISVSRTIRDEEGSALGRDHLFKFRTVDEIVQIPPVISAISPTVGGEDVDPGANVEITFSTAMDEKSMNEKNIKISSGRETVVGIVRYYPSLQRAVFVPDRQLKTDTRYSVQVADVKDSRGVAMEHPREWSFRTSRSAPIVQKEIPRADAVKAEAQRLRRIRDRIGEGKTASSSTETKPMAKNDQNKPLSVLLVEQYPAAGVDGIAPDTEVRVRFRDDMNPASLNIFNFALKEGGDFIFGRVEYDNETRMVRFIPAGRLKANTRYSVVLAGRVEFADGRRIGKDIEWSFETVKPLATYTAQRPAIEEKPDMAAPQVLSVLPADRAEEVAATTQITARFNESLKDFSINSFTFRVHDGENDIEGRTAWNEQELTATFRPADPLTSGRAYTALLTRGIMDKSGIYMQQEKRWSFLVGQRWNTATPRLVSFAPAAGLIPAGDTPLQAVFSEALNARTVHSDNVRLLSAGKAVAGEVTLLADGKTVSFRPRNNLLPGGNYQLEIGGDLEGSAGHRLEKPVSATFSVEQTIADRSAPATSLASTHDAQLEMKVIENLQDRANAGVNSKATDEYSVGPTELAKRMALSDRSPAGNVSPRRIRDEMTVSRKDLLGRSLSATDQAMKEDVRLQIEKFLGESSRQNRELLNRVEKINDREQALISAAAVSSPVETTVKNGRTVAGSEAVMMQRERESLFRDELPYDELRRLNDANPGSVAAVPEAIAQPTSNIVSDGRHQGGSGMINGVPIADLDPSLAPIVEPVLPPALTPSIVDDSNDLMVTAIHPKRNKINVNPEEIVTVSFNKDVDLSSVSSMSFIVSQGEELVDGRIIYNPRLNKVIFRPKDKLKGGAGYRVNLTSGIRTRDGRPLRPINWDFETASM